MLFLASGGPRDAVSQKGGSPLLTGVPKYALPLRILGWQQWERWL